MSAYFEDYLHLAGTEVFHGGFSYNVNPALGMKEPLSDQHHLLYLGRIERSIFSHVDRLLVQFVNDGGLVPRPKSIVEGEENIADLYQRRLQPPRIFYSSQRKIDPFIVGKVTQR